MSLVSPNETNLIDLSDEQNLHELFTLEQDAELAQTHTKDISMTLLPRVGW